MSTNQELETRIENLEKTVNLLLEALEGSVSDQKLDEVKECLNPTPKLTEAQQEAQDSVLLKSYYGTRRYEEQFAHLPAEEKKFEAWKVCGGW